MKPFWKNRKVPMNYIGEYVIYSTDLRKQYYERTKEELSYEGIDYIVALTISKEMEDLLVKSSAADVKQRMVDHAQRESQKTVSHLIELCSSRRAQMKQIEGIPNPVIRLKAYFTLAEELKSSCGNAVRSLCGRLEKIPEYEWNAFKTSQKEYKKYQGKSAVKVIAGSAGLTVSVASLAASGFTGGGSLALSIIAIQRSSVDLYQNIRSLAIAAEKVLKDLVKDMETLHAANADPNKKNLAKREYFASATKALTGYGGAVATVRGLRSNFDLLKSKHQGLMSEGHRYTVLLVAQINNIDKMGTYLRTKEYGPKQARRVSSLIDVTGDKLDMYLNAAIDFNKRWNNIGLAINRLQPEIGQLSKNSPRTAEIVGRCLETLANLSLSAASGAGSIQGATGLLEMGKEVTTLVTDLAKEGIMSGLDIKESLDSKAQASRSYA